MKIIRPFAKLFFYLSRGLATFYGLAALLVVITLILNGIFPDASWVPIEIYDKVLEGGIQTRFNVLLPVIYKPFILGIYSAWGILEICLGLSLYGLFFFLLSQIFNAFRQEKLFTNVAIKNLMNFSLANLILPPVFLLFLHVNPGYVVEGGEVLVTGLHLLLATFAFFQAAIFKEGFTLQQEQDLTI